MQNGLKPQPGQWFFKSFLTCEQAYLQRSYSIWYLVLGGHTICFGARPNVTCWVEGNAPSWCWFISLAPRWTYKNKLVSNGTKWICWKVWILSEYVVLAHGLFLHCIGKQKGSSWRGQWKGGAKPHYMFLEVEEANSWIWKSSFSLGLLGRQILWHSKWCKGID